MTSSIDRATIQIQEYKDKTLDCLATFMKNQINKYAKSKRFPPVVKTAIVGNFTANIIGDNLPLLVFAREECTYNYEAYQRTCNVSFKYYLAIPDQTYLIGLVDWVSKAINKSLVDINREQIGVEVITEERSHSYTLSNNSYTNAANAFIVGSFNITDSSEV